MPQPGLNEDILTAVFDRIYDQTTLGNSVDAVSISKAHILRDVLRRRLLQRQINLSSHMLSESETLIQFLTQETPNARALAARVRYLALYLGPSKNAHKDMFLREPFLDDKVQAGRDLAASVVPLLQIATNLRHLCWNKAPFPNAELLELLSLLPHFDSLAVDCATGFWSGRNMDECDEYWEIQPLFSTLGPRLTSLDLRDVNEDTFETIAANFSAMEKLQNLRLDLTCGVWDWDGGGSPQRGPSERYVFPTISDRIKRFELVVTDACVRPKAIGPVKIVDTNQLEELIIYVTHCYDWMSVDRIHIFASLSAQNFTSLAHLELYDEVWNEARGQYEIPEHFDGWAESGRTYEGIHEFISELPCLRHLWVNERCLLPMADPFNDIPEFESNLSSDEEMENIVGTPSWTALAKAFGKLESLRVGFGLLGTNWVREVLDICDKGKLKQFGFYWNWKAYGVNSPICPRLLELLSETSIADIHILHARPDTPNQQQDARTLADVQDIFEICPSVCRVGVGRNVVWERATPWDPETDTRTPIQLLGEQNNRETIPRFYNAGSATSLQRKRYDTDVSVQDIPAENSQLLTMLQALA